MFRVDILLCNNPWSWCTWLLYPRIYVSYTISLKMQQLVYPRDGISKFLHGFNTHHAMICCHYISVNTRMNSDCLRGSDLHLTAGPSVRGRRLCWRACKLKTCRSCWPAVFSPAVVNLERSGLQLSLNAITTRFYTKKETCSYIPIWQWTNICALSFFNVKIVYFNSLPHRKAWPCQFPAPHPWMLWCFNWAAPK